MACQTVNTKDGVMVITTTAEAAYCATCGKTCCNCEPCVRAKGAPSCTINLPYPAPECGMWRVSCKRCPFTVWITAAGRVDDPRVVIIACRAKAEAN